MIKCASVTDSVLKEDCDARDVRNDEKTSMEDTASCTLKKSPLMLEVSLLRLSLLMENREDMDVMEPKPSRNAFLRGGPAGSDIFLL